MTQKTIYKKSPLVNGDNLDHEFNELEKSLTTLEDFIVMEETHVEPKKVLPLMVRFADGTDWNPDNKGRGLYIYDNGWKKFNLE